MQSLQLLSLSLSFLLTPLAAFPTPEFACIGPWEGEFFGRDPGQDYRPGAVYPVTMMADPNAPPVVANPYGYDGPPPGFEFETEAPPPPPPPPLEPLDLMNAPKEQLPALLPQPPLPPPPPQDAQGTGNSAAAASESEKQEGGDFDFMGGRWGIAGQGKYIDAAHGDHSMKFDRKRLRDGHDDSEKKEKLPEDERKKTEEQEAEEKRKQEMPPVEVVQDSDHPLRYKVNVGGVKSPEQGAPTNFHVFTNEGGKQMSSNDMNPETEKYIMEKMVPKMSGRRKKGGNGGGNSFSLYADGN